MKYKVGDKVRVKSLDWYRKAPKDIIGSIKNIPGPSIVEMSTYCGKMATIIEVEENSSKIIPHCTTFYRLDIDNRKWAWSEEMFEELNNNNKNMKKSDLKPGMVVETREGEKGFIIKVDDKLYYANNDCWNSISDYYDEDLIDKRYELTIDKVYKVKRASNFTFIFNHTEYLTLLWERPKEVELTLDEIAAKFNIPVEQLKIKK